VTEEENLKRLGLEGLAKRLYMCSLQKINPSWLDVPAYVVRRRSRMNGEEKIIEDCGKGLTVDSAIESAVYEAVERRSAEIVQNKSFVTSSYAKLKQNAVPIQILLGSQVPNDIDNLVWEWYESYDLLTKQKIFVPANWVFFPYSRKCYASNTTGLGAGRSLDEAVLHGMYEVIETDTLSIYMPNSLLGKPVKLEENDGCAYEAFRRCSKSDVDISLSFLPNDSHIPVFFCLARNIPELPNIIACGVGCRLDANAAATQAIIECAQSVSFCFYDRERELPEMTDGVHPPVHFSHLHKAGKETSINLATVPSVEIRSTEQETREVLKRLSDFASHVVIADLTDPAFKIPVVRVVMPNFENGICDGIIKKRAQRVREALQIYLGR
jgi:ribosomal protein S12 methylthiotransferase accessory factor